MEEYIAKNITDYRAQASSIFSKVKTLFNDNELKLPKSTSIEIRGLLHPGPLLKHFRGKNLRAPGRRGKKEEYHKDENPKNETTRC